MALQGEQCEYLVYQQCDVATLDEAVSSAYGLIKDAAILVADGIVDWVGPRGALPDIAQNLDAISLGGRLVTPSLVDCHTHIVFGGNRAREFEMRLQGVSYEEISRQGGGIVSTVKATRDATDADLLAGALKRVDALMAEGICALEIKSGYGLSIEHEMRQLRIARKIGEMRPINVQTTWLAAHAIAQEYKGRADAYIDEVAIAGLRAAHAEGLVDAVDGFCETIGFSNAQMRRVFEVAAALGLPMKLHAEQLSDQKGALLAAEFGALSADHLEYLAETDVENFAQSGAVAVLLPGAFYTLKETQLPPIAAMREYGVDIALATDCNPGSSPITSVLTIMNMACTLFGMEPEEALAGVTRNGAKALGLSQTHGLIKKGRAADFAVWDVTHPAELSYWMGASPLHERIFTQGLT